MTTNIKKHKKGIVHSMTLSRPDRKTALSQCDILHAISLMNDEILMKLNGALDYGKIAIRQYMLDIDGSAGTNDVVTIQGYASKNNNGIVEVHMVGKRSGGYKNNTFIRGRFVFAALVT